MKISILIFCLLSSLPFVQAQERLTVEDCYKRAENNYPLIAQRGLIEQTGVLSIENAAAGRLPQVTVGGQATYQSDVTQIPFEMPNVDPLSKDQYRIYGEISQNIYRGGTIGRQVKAEEINALVESRKLDVELYSLRSRVNELFFGILMLDAQRSQSELVKSDLVAALRTVEAGIRNGTVLRSAADVLNAQILRLDQRIIEQETAALSMREVLGLFIDYPVSPQTVLVKPDWSAGEGDFNRPEIKVFDVQEQAIEASRSLLSASRKPRVELFLQGGYGRPALNMLDNNFDFFYLGGVRFNWRLSGVYTFRRDNELLDLRRQSLDAQRETFLFNSDLTARQHTAEVEKLNRLIQVDDEIIDLRLRVQNTASSQLEAGVISASDYINEVNATDQAKQDRVLHEVQLLIAIARYKYTTGQ